MGFKHREREETNIGLMRRCRVTLVKEFLSRSKRVQDLRRAEELYVATTFVPS